MEISILLIVVLAGESYIYIYIKGCQVLCLKLSRFIVYFIFDRICGVEKRGKEKGRVEEE